MFGFIIGSACVVGLAMMAARGRRHGFHHEFHHGHRRRGGFGKRALYHLFDRLDTTPGQEKAILAAIDDFRGRARDARGDLRDVRKRVAEAMRAEHFDEPAFAAIFDEPLHRLSTLRDDMSKTVAGIHETLTPKQREYVSDVVESNTRWGFGYAC
jgi:Spy/CpxP family protein refolding chaperone